MNKYLTTVGVPVVALLVGVGIGVVASPSDPTESDEYQHQVSLVQQKNDGLNDAISALEQAGEDIDALDAKYSEEIGDLPDRESALQEGIEQLAADQQVLDDARRDTLTLLKGVRRREKAVGIVEREIEANTIRGNGTYRVGADIQPGTYRSEPNRGSCYWSVNADANGANILSNNFGSGPQLAQVGAGQFFETSSCNDWVLQR